MEGLKMLQKIRDWYNKLKDEKVYVERLVIYTDPNNDDLWKDIYFIIKNKYKDIEISDIYIIVIDSVGTTIKRKAKSYYRKDDKILVKFTDEGFKIGFNRNIYRIESITLVTSKGIFTKGVYNANRNYRKSQVQRKD
jgi:hypothetical protein